MLQKTSKRKLFFKKTKNQQRVRKMHMHFSDTLDIDIDIDIKPGKIKLAKFSAN